MEGGLARRKSLFARPVSISTLSFCCIAAKCLLAAGAKTLIQVLSATKTRPINGKAQAGTIEPAPCAPLRSVLCPVAGRYALLAPCCAVSFLSGFCQLSVRVSLLLTRFSSAFFRFDLFPAPCLIF
jgi:hypothetical protein